jgi:thiol-disulfide isomerase/thioredoxin
MSYPVSLTIDVLMLLMAAVLLMGKEQVKFLSVSAPLSRISLPSMSKRRAVLHTATEFTLLAVLVLAVGIPLHGGTAQSPIYTDIDNSLRAGKPVFLYFYIEGCDDCDLQKPIIDKLEQEYESKIGFVRVDYRAEADVVLRFDIHGTPNILLITDRRSDGEYYVYKRFSGLTDEETLRYFLTVVSNQPFNGAPSPSPTPSPTPTLTLEPTPTLSPTSTPMPIPTPEPTPMPTLELTPSPTLMPTPTPTLMPPPQADFVGSPTVCNGQTTVQFTDQSTGEITSWSWDFGDGHTSTLQNPSNYYTNDGLYTVTLAATGPGGTDVETKNSYIYVQGCST